MLDEELRDEMIIWKLVLSGTATLQEIDSFWTLEDIYKANGMLDMRAWLQEKGAEVVRNNS